MMSFLTRIYRKYFCSRPKRLLLELFDSVPEAKSGIVLEEIGLPNGTVTTYRWWKTDRVAFFFKAHAPSLAGEAVSDALVEDTKKRFDELLSIVKRLDQPALRNHSGSIRDGVLFSIAWGSEKNLRDLTIRNPEPRSRYIKLVRELKENAW
ncbi:MAG TPA: hypothetical protein VMY42_00440 [Thermoguttaceae bacterium]|nr:hypothetical protein [Thermoguttaceae bacterium]